MIGALRVLPVERLWPWLAVPLAAIIGQLGYRFLIHSDVPDHIGSVLWITAAFSAPAGLAFAVEIINRATHAIPVRTRRLLWWLSLIALLYPIGLHLVQLGFFVDGEQAKIDTAQLSRFNRVLLSQIAITAGLCLLFLLITSRLLPDSLKAPRSRRGELGNASFMSLAEARRNFRKGGIILGEAFQPYKDRYLFDQPFDPKRKSTWGKGPKKPLLRTDADTASGHGLVFVGSGGFKTTGFAVPTALEWDGPIVCFDPSIEIGPLVHAERKRKGYRVIALDPQFADTNGFNALEWVTARPDDMDENIGIIASWIIGPTANLSGNAKYFGESADMLIRAVLADMLHNPSIPDENKTLLQMRDLIAQDSTNLRKYLESVSKTSDSAMAKSLASTLYGLADEQFSGIAGQAQTATAWLEVSKFGKLVSGDGFSLGEVIDGTLDVYINIPLESLISTPAIGKIVMAAFMNRMMQADGTYAKRTLFLIDEAFQLGKDFTPLIKARDVGRKYGMTLALIYQSVGQLVTNYGEDGRKAFFESAAYRIYSAIQDQQTAQQLSDECGNYTGYTRSRSTSMRWGLFGNDSFGSNRQIVEVPLMTADEVKTMRRDEALIFTVGNRPLRCSRPIYWRRADMVNRVGSNRFQKTP